MVETYSTWGMIDTRIKVMDAFYKQVDKTRKRLNLTPFKLKDPLTGKELSDVINVTENRSASYMARIIAGLMSSKWQTVVEGSSISKRDAHKIELFIEDNLQQADEYLLSEYGLTGLNAWLCNHVCHTSLIGVQWMSYFDDEEEYKIHCLPLDMRWTPFVQNKWMAPITYRSKEDLIQELESYKQRAVDFPDGNEFSSIDFSTLKDEANEVRDFWDTAKNELMIAGQLVFRQRNPYGKLPSVFLWPPSGFMLRDKDYLAHESPGVTFLNEELFDQVSRQLSIDASLGFNSLLPAYEKERETLSADGVSEPAPKRGQSLDVLEGERHIPVPTPDINRAELATREQISRLIDDAAPMSPRSYTTPPSAIEVATEVELIDELQNPRTIALQMFREQLARLIIDQVITISGDRNSEILAGKRGKRRSFTLGDLKDPEKYTISYQMMKQNKRLAIVNESRALALWGKAPMKYILRDVLAVEDPDGWMREMEIERAKSANPALTLAEMAVRYAEEADDTEDETDKEFKIWQWKMLVHDYVTLMRQRLQPAMPQGETQNIREATKETGNSQGLVSMLGAGGGTPQLPAATKGVTMQ